MLTPDSVQDKSVPAEQISEEAKKQEPDAVEQADKVRSGLCGTVDGRADS